jgi:hypothetical protein
LGEIESAVAKWRLQDPKEYANRGKPNEQTLAEAIRREGEKLGCGAGRIRVVDRSAHPQYQPLIWNDGGTVQLSTNCYAYACNDPYGHALDDKPQPGMLQGPRASKEVLRATKATPIVLEVANHRLNTGSLVHVWGIRGNTAANTYDGNGRAIRRPWIITNIDNNRFSLNGSSGNGYYSGGGKLSQAPTNSAVRLQVLMDDQTRNHERVRRLIPLVRLREDIQTNAPIEVVNVPGYYLIALVVAKGKDYHWYRQDDSGYWSHKPGHTKATNLDASGKVIVDPRECNLGIYSFTNFYYAPKGGVRTASLGDWNNPSWHY